MAKQRGACRLVRERTAGSSQPLALGLSLWMAWATPFVFPSQKTQSLNWSPAGLSLSLPFPSLSSLPFPALPSFRQSVLVQAETLTSWDLLHFIITCAFKPGVRGVTNGSTPQECTVSSVLGSECWYADCHSRAPHRDRFRAVYSIQFDVFNVLGGNWDPTDKKFSSVNSENAEFA